MVAMQAEFFDMFSAQRREIFHPEIGITEFGKEFLWQVHLSQDVILPLHFGLLFSILLFLLLLLAIFSSSLLSFLLFPFTLFLRLLLLHFFLLTFGSDRWRRRKLWRESVGSQFVVQFFSCSRNGHS